MNRMVFTIGIAVLGSLAAFARPALAAAGAVPTAGLAATSLVVGGAGAVLSDSWWVRALGYGVGLVDPDPATFYEGKIVIAYPADLLSITSVGWFGNFAANPSLAVPPVVSSPFFELDPTNTPYNLGQAPAPSLRTSMSTSGGLLTIRFDAPGGISVDQGAHFNLLAFTFQNISGQDLLWRTVGPSGSANFYSDAAQQILTCRPDPNYLTPVTCGNDTEAYRYQVTAVPEPSSMILLGTGASVLFLRWRQRPRRHEGVA